MPCLRTVRTHRGRDLPTRLICSERFTTPLSPAVCLAGNDRSHWLSLAEAELSSQRRSRAGALARGAAADPARSRTQSMGCCTRRAAALPGARGSREHRETLPRPSLRTAYERGPLDRRHRTALSRRWKPLLARARAETIGHAPVQADGERCGLHRPSRREVLCTGVAGPD